MQLKGPDRMQLYRLLTGPDDSSFCHKVTEALNKGWQLHGSPVYTFDLETHALRCAQAVVKTVEGKTYDPSLKLGEQ
jgi:hypothetical protein